ncbi:metallophosphoesterase family protein [Yinghuangia seranimata]|uniref:metallophosphoesterase family protein n=1 Tax=Yinghuangia seranimata TaxID=408067 RepID=UPI00248BE5A5|nr:metallophosphoesterase [Yinghuangia seranimata]MDI2130119.1 metallophosphoesterase [Yinghuangia seranimata]
MNPHLSVEAAPDRAGTPDQPPATGPWTHLDIADAPGRFTFALISDRTGIARPGVFERGIAALNLLRPAFAVQLGDLIEGYTDDEGVLAEAWAELDRIVAPLDMPLFLVPGNHDVSDDLARRHWLGRYGRLHHHFRYKDVLFLVLDTQDPPVEQSPEALEALAKMHAYAERDPEGLRRLVEKSVDWEGDQAMARVSEEQTAWAENVIRENADARWTFVLMHQPIWQGEGHPAIHRIRAALGDRPYTMFAGHVHNYKNAVIDGRDHIRLGPTGGLWVKPEGDEGNFDHITLITMEPDGPRIANVTLEGLRDHHGRLLE